MDTNQLICSAYNILLNRDPDADGAYFWRDKLENGMSREQFLNSIILSDEFRRAKPTWLDLGLWNKCIDLNAEIVLDLPIGKFCGPANDYSVFVSILQQNGAYEPHVTKAIQEHLTLGNTFVDIGANLGYFTLTASRLVGPFGKVVAFEPGTEAYNYCKKNIERNKLSNVNLYKNGLWNEKKRLLISDSHQMGFNHISDNGDSVECILLDSMNLTPDLIKIDIEGAEPYALQGMVETLKRCHPTIVMEINRHCLKSFFGKDSEDVYYQLNDLEYDISVIPGGKRIESIEQLNILCPPKGLIDILAEHR